jgi:hypothetical protein
LDKIAARAARDETDRMVGMGRVDRPVPKQWRKDIAGLAAIMAGCPT